jgi:parallel beta-helix repeat protein
MSIRAGVVGIVCSLLISGTAVIGDSSSEGGSAYTPHSTIYIFGNEDFNAVNGVTGGSGTELDPYVIEGWEIEAGKVSGITIRETSAHFVIRDVLVHSSEMTYYGISLRNLVNGCVQKSNLTENWKGLNVRESGSVDITGNDITYNNEGVYIRDSTDITIEGNIVSNNLPYNGLAVILSSNVTIQANTVSQNNWAGISISSSNALTILENDITMNQYEGVRVVSSTDINFMGNTLSENLEGMGLITSSFINVSSTDATLNRFHGIHAESSSNVTIDLSYISVNGINGIYLWNTTDTTITRTIFRSNDFAIHISDSKNITASENIPWSNSNGAYVETSSNITFNGNDVYDNWVHGIIAADSNDLKFLRNRFHSNNVDGIRMVGSTNYSVINNIFSENMRGLYFENSEGISTFHNEFRNHTNQLRDNKGIENAWDDGYPSGGNFWSDYAGSDQFNGPSQNESGQDNIGDVPYMIDPNSQDTYPLMSPPGSVPSAPKNLQASWGDSYVNITWSPPSSDGGFPVTTYRIYRGTTSGGEVTLDDRLWFTYFNDTSVSNGVHYYYEVSALNGVGEGPKSNEAASIPTAIPGPPTAMQAVLSGNDRENVTVNWSLSIDDGTGQGSVIEYQVYRGSNYSPSSDGYQLIASLPNGTLSFEDGLAGGGDSSDYFYRVCAVDVNNKTRCSEDQSGKFTRSLSKGLNLVSVPLITVDSSINSVLEGVPFSEAWFFDSIDKKWISIVKSKPYSLASINIDHTMGFWINVTEDSNLTVAGLVPSTFDVLLTSGWNLIGFPSYGQNITAGDLKSLLTAETIEGFDPSPTPYNLRTLQDSEVILVGYGYWIWVDSSGSFHLG